MSEILQSMTALMADIANELDNYKTDEDYALFEGDELHKSLGQSLEIIKAALPSIVLVESLFCETLGPKAFLKRWKSLMEEMQDLSNSRPTAELKSYITKLGENNGSE